MQNTQNVKKDRKLSLINKTSNKKLENKLTYQNPKLLALFMDDRKKILSRNITGLSFQQQKKLNKAVKNARILGMYPFTMPLM
jgi:small subunit ribosomal protein S18|tara:strand:- start:192 stop:440 length:249 start_codon:yes stop_codon:yes gene_type:complete